jgi:hypothetical protein
MRRSQRAYFLLLALAGVAGWSSGLWAVPLVAFAALEAAWTAAGWARGRDPAPRAPRTPYVR